jgi:hypothetical protein
VCELLFCNNGNNSSSPPDVWNTRLPMTHEACC